MNQVKMESRDGVMSDLSKQFDLLHDMLTHFKKETTQAVKTWESVTLPATGKSCRWIEKMVGQVIAGERNPVELDKLQKKAEGKYKRIVEDPFSRREIWYLPFILLHPNNTVPLTKYIFEQIDLKKGLTFDYAMSTFFKNYSPKDLRADFLRGKLYTGVRKDENIANRNSFLLNHSFLLFNDGTGVLGSRIVRQGIANALTNIEFPCYLWDSCFVKMAIQEAFQVNYAIENKFRLLNELLQYEDYADLFPHVIGSLIIATDKEGDGNLKNELMDLIFQKMGAPGGKSTGWMYVSKEAKEIFYHWMVKNDFGTFFDLIAGAVLAAGAAMWKARQSFWSQYLNDISLSRIVLGEDARKKVKSLNKKLTNYDILTAKSNDSCLLVFRLGNYTFVESSHNGSLRVYAKENEPVDFLADEHKTINYNDMIKLETVAVFRHQGMWQRKVRDWISMNCHIVI